MQLNSLGTLLLKNQKFKLEQPFQTTMFNNWRLKKHHAACLCVEPEIPVPWQRDVKLYHSMAKSFKLWYFILSSDLNHF